VPALMMRSASPWVRFSGFIRCSPCSRSRHHVLLGSGRARLTEARPESSLDSAPFSSSFSSSISPSTHWGWRHHQGPRAKGGRNNDRNQHGEHVRSTLFTGLAFLNERCAKKRRCPSILFPRAGGCCHRTGWLAPGDGPWSRGRQGGGGWPGGSS
jgi:hypothetical protein